MPVNPVACNTVLEHLLTYVKTDNPSSLLPSATCRFGSPRPHKEAPHQHRGTEGAWNRSPCLEHHPLGCPCGWMAGGWKLPQVTCMDSASAGIFGTPSPPAIHCMSCQEVPGPKHLKRSVPRLKSQRGSEKAGSSRKLALVRSTWNRQTNRSQTLLLAHSDHQSSLRRA